MRLTASGIALARACGHSFRDDVDLVHGKTDEARRGDAFGMLAEQRINAITVPMSEALADLSGDEASRLSAMWGHAQAWLEANQRLGWQAEVAFAWDPVSDTARQLLRDPKAPRAYREMGANDVEVCGTADIVAIDGDSVVVYDWKSHAPGAPKTDARDQLEALALFAARAWGYDSARIMTLDVTAERGVEPIEHEPLDTFGLSAVAVRLQTLVGTLPTSHAEPGDHCTERYCKAIASCPATVKGLGDLIPETALVRKGWAFQPVIDSPDHLAHILTIRPLIRKAMDQVDAAVEAFVAAGPVRTSDGREIKRTMRSMVRLNQGALIELAKAKGATDEELASCYRTAMEGNGVRVTGGRKGRGA